MVLEPTPLHFMQTYVSRVDAPTSVDFTYFVGADRLLDEVALRRGGELGIGGRWQIFLASYGICLSNDPMRRMLEAPGLERKKEAGGENAETPCNGPGTSKRRV